MKRIRTKSFRIFRMTALSVLLGLSLLALSLMFTRPPVVTAAATITVNATSDLVNSTDGKCTLREAIIAANTDTASGVTAGECVAGSGTDAINFAIPGTDTGCDGTTHVCTITPTSALPAITNPVTIDGYTQSGSSANTLAVGNDSVHLIELNGNGAAFPGFNISAGNSTLRGLVINRFNGNGPANAININTNGGNKIEGCFIGLSADGTTAQSNSRLGIDIESSPNNTIGGTTPAARNVISSNASGQSILINGTTSSGTTIQGNYIGTNAAGTAASAGSIIGVQIGTNGGGTGSSNNTIGGTTAAARNVISGHASDGIKLFDDTVTGNVIQGNYIGTNAAGTAAVGNGTGVDLLRTNDTTIGGTVAGAGNLISGNSGDGISLDGSRNLVQGNLIGTDVTGTAKVPNGFRGIEMAVDGSNAGSNNTIGGTTPGARNIISGNGGGGNSHGIRLELLGTTSGNLIQGNFIGTDITGTVALGNAGAGIQIFESSLATHVNTIGGTTAAARNIISGNSGGGIFGGGHNILIQGNYIGTAVNGTSNLGNVGSGIDLNATDNNTVGGPAAGAGNVIAFNGQDGVRLPSSSSGGVVSGVGNSIRGNSIFSNGKLGINLLGGTENAAGVTANDSCDGDDGANRLQNFPVLSFAGGILSGTLNSTASTTFIIEFFSNASPDGSGFGEGQTFLGSITAGTDASCAASFNDVKFPISVPAGQWITATAIDPNGNTSEFSQAIQLTSPTAADGSISGRITSDSGAPVEGAVIHLSGGQTRKTITDANGNYHFNNVGVNGFYTVTPSRVNYNFTPFNRSFNLLGNNTEAAFAAISTGDNRNPLDTPEYFVRQQYVDILGREPDEGGFNYWSDQINQCMSVPPSGSPEDCIRSRRVDVAAAFFIEAEFQQTGSFIYDLYRGALGRRPVFTEYSTDRRQVLGGPNLDAEKAAFAQSFVQRPEFVTKYQGAMTAGSFVDALIQNVQQVSGVDLSSQRDALIARYNNGADMSQSRSFVLSDVAANSAFNQAQYNPAFVLTEYFGYLQRNPDQGGYNFWLNVIDNREVGNYRGMVCAFITSTEYQRRFSSVVSHGNGECGP